jgi:predicted histidine transporter YuiF (NhaC family)
MSADGHDNWHQHTAEEGMPQEEHGAQASAKALGLTFIGMVIGVLLVIIVLYIYFDSYMDSYRAKIDENTKAAEATWIEKNDMLNNLAPAVEIASEQVIAEYASSN